MHAWRERPPQGGAGLHVEGPHAARLARVGAGQHARAERRRCRDRAAGPQGLHLRPRILVARVHLIRQASAEKYIVPVQHAIIRKRSQEVRSFVMFAALYEGGFQLPACPRRTRRSGAATCCAFPRAASSSAAAAQSACAGMQADGPVSFTHQKMHASQPLTQ